MTNDTFPYLAQESGDLSMKCVRQACQIYKKIMMVPPTHFDVIHKNLNVHMTCEEPVDKVLAMQQWENLRRTYQDLGLQPEICQPHPGEINRRCNRFSWLNLILFYYNLFRLKGVTLSVLSLCAVLLLPVSQYQFMTSYFVFVLLVVIMIFTIAAKLCKKAVTGSNFDFFEGYLRVILGWL